MLGLITFCMCIWNVLIYIFRHFMNMLILAHIYIETGAFYFLERFTEGRCNIVYGHTFVIFGSMIPCILGWWSVGMWNDVYVAIISHMLICIIMPPKSNYEN